MKSFGLHLLTLALLVTLVSCGKDNESGKSSWNYSSQYGYGGWGQYGTGYNNYSYGGQNVQAIMQHNPCTTGAQMRSTIQFPLTGFNSYIGPNEIYAGVTSYGDVAFVIGTGNGAPMFVAQVCQRSNYAQGQGQLTDLAIGAYSQCAFKQLTRATLVIPGSPAPLYFRMLEGGNSAGQPFPFCRTGY